MEFVLQEVEVDQGEAQETVVQEDQEEMGNQVEVDQDQLMDKGKWKRWRFKRNWIKSYWSRRNRKGWIA